MPYFGDNAAFVNINEDSNKLLEIKVHSWK